MIPLGIALGVKFQSTLPRRERLGYPGSFMSLICFNPRSHEGSDYESIMEQLPGKRFQSTLPRRERPDSISLYISSILFQSTLPRRERRYGGNGCGACVCVSIHAPTKGATNHADTYSQAFNVSIHAPTKGAT